MRHATVPHLDIKPLEHIINPFNQFTDRKQAKEFNARTVTAKCNKIYSLSCERALMLFSWSLNRRNSAGAFLFSEKKIQNTTRNGRPCKKYLQRVHFLRHLLACVLVNNAGKFNFLWVTTRIP